MFNIFKKKKPKLLELIPKNFVDIHSHILPGIDDGAKNVNESKKLISNFQKLGFSKIIATPHTYSGLYDNTSESISKSFDLLVKNLNSEISLSFASEYMIDISLIEKSENKSLLCIKDNYVLIEFGFLSVTSNIFDIIFKLRVNNYIPIIAHPERYLYKSNDIDFFKKLKNAGCYLQINLFSLTGYYGNEVLKMVKKLMKEELVDFVGSDVHNLNQLKVFENEIMSGEIPIIEKSIERTLFFQ